MIEMYRLSWEIIKPSRLHLYTDANPTFYKRVKQVVPDVEIPDEDWQKASRMTDEPWEQYLRLIQRQQDGQGGIRNLRIERLVAEPVWEEFVPDLTEMWAGS